LHNRERGVGVAHCPVSNYIIHSGEMRTREYLTKGIKVGLGTDISAGPSPGILSVIRQAIIASNALDFEVSFEFESLLMLALIPLL